MRVIEASREISKCSSWKELNEELEKLTKSDQAKFAGDIFELATKHFLLTDSRYQSILKNVWLLDEVPEIIKLKLNIPDQDEGIDLIAETKLGKFWSIQSKYRSDPNENLTLGGKGGLATFSSLSFRYCKNISHGLVVTTVNKPPKKMKLISDIGFETLESFLSLDDNQFEGWEILRNNSLKKIIKPKKLSPRPHQKTGINKAIKYFENNDRGKLVMPCGTGKSLLAFWVARDMKVKNILIAVPSLALIQQTLKIWTRELLVNDLNADWLCVCSDNSVKEDQDSFVSFTYDLGIQVTTNKEDIQKFLRRKTSNYKIIFTTYQSGKIISEASKGFSYDLSIMDEAHKTVGHKEKLSSHLMHEKNINVKKRLFMTATERLFRANSNEYLSMDSKKNYGEIIYELSFKKAIETNPPIIADYKIITFNVTDQDIQKIHSDNKFIKVEKELENITAREFATAIALRKAIKKINIKNAISFHSSIKRAKNFQRQQEIIDQIYPEFEKLETFHVSGDMPVSKRASQMRLFAEEKGLMTNARCLTEGVDLPAIDCVCFTDPKRSKIDIVQAAGRALRLSKVMKKKIGYILVPLYVPENMDPEIASKGTSFEEIISVIGALSTQDSRIAEYLKGITMGRKPSVGNKVDGIISINTLTKINAEKFEKAILIKIWDKIARVNFVTYEEAKKYVSKYNFSGKREFKLHSTKNIFPKDIPRSPETVYNISWEGWGKFLGTGNRILAPGRDMNTNWRSYEEAKKYVLNQKYSGKRAFTLDSRKTSFPSDIPRRPELVYKNFWKNWGDFLGTGRITSGKDRNQNTNWRSYEEAKKYVLNQKYTSKRYFNLDSRKTSFPGDIPRRPDLVYKNFWKNWGDFLGTGYVSSSIGRSKKTNWRTYEEAKDFAQRLKFKSSREWALYAKNSKKFPADIPKGPDSNIKYKDKWEGWEIFLGNKNREE